MRIPWWYLVALAGLLGTLAYGSEPKWVIAPGDDSSPYRDIVSRHDGGHGDIHENCHMLIGRLSNGGRALYSMRGRYVVVPEPPVSFAAFRDAVPMCLRGKSSWSYFRDYAVQYADAPLIILEEWVCYSNGWESPRDYTQNPTFFADFIGYAVVLRSLLNSESYGELQLLTDWIAWQALRTIDQLGKRPPPDTLIALRNSDEAKDLRRFIWRTFDPKTAEAILVAASSDSTDSKTEPDVQDSEQPSASGHWEYRGIFGRRKVWVDDAPAAKDEESDNPISTERPCLT